MRRILMILMLLALANGGCSNPCQERLTNSEIDILASALEDAKNDGLTADDAIILGADLCFDRLCRDCVEFLVLTVY